MVNKTIACNFSQFACFLLCIPKFDDSLLKWFQQFQQEIMYDVIKLNHYSMSLNDWLIYSFYVNVIYYYDYVFV